MTELVARLGPELRILQDVPVEDIAAAGATLLAEAVSRLRRGEVIRDSGYDGEYGVIRCSPPTSWPNPRCSRWPRRPPSRCRRGRPPLPRQEPEPNAGRPLTVEAGLLGGLDPEQRAAAEVTDGPLLIVAGPGTGKTRTLTHRLAHLVAEQDVPAERCLAITFTRRAADELRERLAALVPEQAARITVATFHALGLAILREQHDRAGLTARFRVAGEAERLAVLTELTGSEADARRAAADLLRLDRALEGHDPPQRTKRPPANSGSGT